MFRAGNAGGDVSEDEIVPTVVSGEAVARGEIHALLPLGFADLRFDGRIGCGHGVEDLLVVAGEHSRGSRARKQARSGRVDMLVT